MASCGYPGKITLTPSLLSLRMPRNGCSGTLASNGKPFMLLCRIILRRQPGPSIVRCLISAARFAFDCCKRFWIAGQRRILCSAVTCLYGSGRRGSVDLFCEADWDLDLEPAELAWPSCARRV